MLDLARDTIFVALAGSQAHGTAQPGSDVDLRGVCIAPLDVRVSLFHHFEQHEEPLEGALWATTLPRLQQHDAGSRGLAVKTESVIYDVAKFLRLCASANPNALELLFTDERDWLLETPAWRQIYAQRTRFLTKKVEQTYLGYAMAQLRKIKTHRATQGDPKVKSARNPARAELERLHGYDTKHAMHLVRMMKTALEVLEHGTLTVRRPDAAELVAIRDGALSFDELLATAADLEGRMTSAAQGSALPEAVDHAWVDALAFELIQPAR